MKGKYGEHTDSLEKIHVDRLAWRPLKRANPILDEISLDLNSGRFYGLLGPNGAGKTSFVRQLLKLQCATSGNVKMDEINLCDIRRKALARNMSFLPQIINNTVEFTVEEIVAMGREPYRKTLAPLSEEDKKIIYDAMVFTDCLEFKDKSIRLLSGGERQRVMIARTIAQDTPWIILDEPVSSLDITHQVKLMQLLDRLRIEKNKTIVAILHDINLAAIFCSDIILMKYGKVVTQGVKKAVLTPDNLEMLYDMQFDVVKRPENQGLYIVPRYKC